VAGNKKEEALKAEELQVARAVVKSYAVCVKDMEMCVEWCKKDYPGVPISSLETGIYYMTRRQAYWKDRIDQTINPKLEN